MTKSTRKSSAEKIHIDIPKESGEDCKHLRLTIPSQIKSTNPNFQSRSKSLLVMTSQISKRNLKNIFTDTGKMAVNTVEKMIPKTKLSARDTPSERRSLSPRLKAFPAEKIKKIDGNALLQPPMPPNEASAATQLEENVGHGDAISSSQQIQITPRSQARNHSKSQQNISYFYQIANSNQSEGGLPSEKFVLPIVQSHRPFASNPPHESTIQETSKKQITEVNPRPITSHMPSSYPSDLPCQTKQENNTLKAKNKVTLRREQNQCQETPQIRPEILESDSEKQVVGGRVAALHRQALLENKPILEKEIPFDNTQQRLHQIQQYNQLPQYQLPQGQVHQQFGLVPSAIHDSVHVSSNSGQHFTDPKIGNVRWQPNVQQVCQKQQQNATYQQGAYGDCYGQMHQTNVGMTSPQDLSRNREKYYRHQAQRMQMPTNFQGNGENLANPNFNQAIVQSQWQYPAPLNYSFQYNHNGLESNQNSSQTYQGRSQNVQNMQNNQYNPQNNSGNYQTDGLNIQERKMAEKRVYHFTPEMLRDQEQLVATMQQQRIPQDVMQRQFQLLLTEQKKQLVFLEELTREGEKVGQQTTNYIPKKMSKLDFEEKPEWMAHITPARISLRELEKAKNNYSQQQVQQQVYQNHAKENQQHHYQNHQGLQEHPLHHQHLVHHHQHAAYQQSPTQHQQLVQSQQVQGHQVPQQQECRNQELENNNRVRKHVGNQFQGQNERNQFQQQHNNQVQQEQCYQHQIHHQMQNPHQNCQHQHQATNLQRPDLYSSRYTHHPHGQCCSMPSLNNTISPNHQHLPAQCHQQHQLQQQIWQNPHQTSPVPLNSNVQPSLEMNSCQSMESPKIASPSSLLKLRLYKNIIQPQMRNNGLQDPMIVKETFEALKSAEGKRGLEYLANVNKREPVIKLNGAQDPSEIPDNFLQKPPSDGPQHVTKRVSANGLENRRNPNNPVPPSKLKHVDNLISEYPPSKKSRQPQNYVCIAEKENGNVDTNCQHHGHRRPQVDYHYQVPLKSWPSIPNSGAVQQNQQLFKNQQMLEAKDQGDFWPGNKDISRNIHMMYPGNDHLNDLQELRIIGGVKYLARKPNSIHHVPFAKDSFHYGHIIPQHAAS